MDRPGQGELFGGGLGAGKRQGGVPVEPATPAPADVATAAALPELLRLGTSSWSFPGWAGIVYARQVSAQKLSRDGLAAYARHPLFRTVGLDRTHYRPLSADQFRAHAVQVDADFRFLVKAHEVLTLFRYPSHPRYGKRKGTENELFLDAGYATSAVVEPALAGLGDRIGVLLFQVAPQSTRPLGGPDAFIDRLHGFLEKLPRGPTYAVEVRNRELLTDRYAAALADTGAVSCLTVLSRMPPLPEQWQLTGAGRGSLLLIRWMVQPGHTYESATERFEPFDRLVAEDGATREVISHLAAAAIQAGQPIHVVINNKAEGSAPLSVFRLARRIAAELGGS